MSNEIIVALIIFTGGILGALISGAASIISSYIQSFPKSNSKNKSTIVIPDGVTISRSRKSHIGWIVFGGAVGLVMGVSLVELKSPATTPIPTQTLLMDTPVILSTPLLVAESATPTETITPTSTHTANPTFTPTTTFTLTNTFTSTPFVILDNNVPMILIPKGSFNKYDKENGYVQVSLPDFYIDQHEVSNAEYQECVDVGICGRPYPAGSDYKNVEHFGDDAYKDYPVVLVSYYRAKTYCEWRGGGTRMPTGEEWEKAARGLLAEQTYPWGNNPPSCDLYSSNGTNYFGCNTRDAFPVMSFAPNGYGLFDMSGNVSEWVDEANKLIRGGSWNDNESRIKVFSTVEGETFRGYVNVGFRCAKDAP